jgi:hypothetical protein
MPLTDPLLPKFNWRKGYWYVTKGRETFYAESPDRLTGGNENDELITFKTEIDAIKWIAESPDRLTGGNQYNFSRHSELSEESKLCCHSERSEESKSCCHSERSEESYAIWD